MYLTWKTSRWMTKKDMDSLETSLTPIPSQSPWLLCTKRTFPSSPCPHRSTFPSPIVRFLFLPVPTPEPSFFILTNLSTSCRNQCIHIFLRKGKTGSCILLTRNSSGPVPWLHFSTGAISSVGNQEKNLHLPSDCLWDIFFLYPFQRSFILPLQACS